VFTPEVLASGVGPSLAKEGELILNDEVTRAFLRMTCGACGWQNLGQDPAKHRAFHLSWDEDNKMQVATCIDCYYVEDRELVKDILDQPDEAPNLAKAAQRRKLQLEDDDQEFAHQHTPSHVHNRIDENFGKMMCACGEPMEDLTESLEQMHRGEGREVQPEELEE
jgi:hypothetical protein